VLIHTRRLLRSFGSGRDPTHLLIDNQGSLVPKHSAFSFGLPLGSCSITIRKRSMKLPDTN
jgi:hypothetical protein